MIVKCARRFRHMDDVVGAMSFARTFKKHPITHLAPAAGLGFLGAASSTKYDDRGRKVERSTAERVAAGTVGAGMGFFLGNRFATGARAASFAQKYRKHHSSAGRAARAERAARGTSSFFGSTFGSKAEAKAKYRSMAREAHPDLHPTDSTATDRFKKLNADWETYQKSKDFEKLASFLTKKAMNLSLITPMAENAALDSAASAMQTNSMEKKFRQPGRFVAPKFGGSNILTPSTATFKQFGAWETKHAHQRSWKNSLS